MDSVKDYKVYNYVLPAYTDVDIEEVDFKRSLMANICLNKSVYKDSTGRPTYSQYSYQGELIAKIYFVFNTDQNNLILSRSEVLKYILMDGSEGKSIIINSKVYDQNNMADVELIVEERIKARKSIISGCKGFISGVLQANAGMTQSQSLEAGASLWSNFSNDIDGFVEFGTEDWRSSLISLDISVDYTWLSTPVDMNGTTIRDYLVSRLTY